MCSDRRTHNRVLAIVAHPDDEVLGAGGALARHAQRGDEVYVACLTDGVSARGHDKKSVERRAVAAHKAATILGANTPQFLGFPDNRLDEIALLDVVQAIETLIEEIQPVTIYTHHAGDLNIDHAVCQRAVMTAFRPLPGSKVRRIVGCEIASSSEWNPLNGRPFIPTCFVDISGTLEIKQRALEAYAEEMRPFPHARSYEAIEALARWRGAMVGLTAAEAFVLLREIDT